MFTVNVVVGNLIENKYVACCGNKDQKMKPSSIGIALLSGGLIIKIPS